MELYDGGKLILKRHYTDVINELKRAGIAKRNYKLWRDVLLFISIISILGIIMWNHNIATKVKAKIDPPLIKHIIENPLPYSLSAWSLPARTEITDLDFHRRLKGITWQITF